MCSSLFSQVNTLGKSSRCLEEMSPVVTKPNLASTPNTHYQVCSAELVWAFVKNVPQVPASRSVPATANWEKARGPTQNVLEGLQPSRQGSCWGSRRKSGRMLLGMNGWMDGRTLYSYSPVMHLLCRVQQG